MSGVLTKTFENRNSKVREDRMDMKNFGFVTNSLKMYL